jgi:hypothetical protein
MRKTAIDYLVEELTSNGGVIYVGQIKKAKEMEKQQILDAHIDASELGGFEASAEDWANRYFNETYKNK